LASAVLSGVAIAALLMAPSPAWAGAAVGPAVLTRPDATTPLDSGGSATEFGVVLPSDASCPGDTAHDGYRTYSYLVPKGISVAVLRMRGELPFRGEPGHPYYGLVALGTYYGSINTDEFTGQIATLPSEFTWSTLTPSDLFSGGVSTAVWEVGIACATGVGVVTDYWNTSVQFTASRTDPGGFTWRVLDPPSAGVNVGLLISVALLILAALFAGTALVITRRQRQMRGTDA
jgi:hypothetical protein